MIEVVTVFTPRPTHEKFMDFGPLLQTQKLCAEKFGHRHVIVSDRTFKDFNTLQVSLPTALMTAILYGQVSYLEQWSGDHPVVLVDADCVIARSLDPAFMLPFDLGLTNREDARSPINNGAMYINAGNKAGVLAFFRKALSLCKNHWGGDQEAISQVAAPVPLPPMHQIESRTIDRERLRLAFFSMLTHNVVPKERGLRHKKNPYIVHFKGEGRKEWMLQYARSFIL